MDPGFMTIRSRRPQDSNSIASADSTYGSASDSCIPATHDIGRVSYHVKHLESFASALTESAARAFPNRGRPSQRYTKVQALLLHWTTDDLFVLPELEDLEKCLRENYSYDTDIFPIPAENSHLELMLKVGDLIKKHESEETLFIIYYGGHARIDESRQSTWCATRHSSSPWLQWSAIQTLLERSMSDVLILLDCCAGAASATFPNGKNITETISASSWDAIAPDPGRYSFTNALIEVLQEWRHRTFSAAMLHAEILARLKHPRPILINGKHFEARSTPVHFMMTSNHKAPSIEFARVVPEKPRPPSPPRELPDSPSTAGPGSQSVVRPGHSVAPLLQDYGRPEVMTPESSIPDAADPNEDEPHVMISLALEEDQRLDLGAWEQWLASFPALAKFVKVQGVFKSHSTLLLLSLPVMVWDLLPDDPACAFVAFIRSNNLLKQQTPPPEPVPAPVPADAYHDMAHEQPRADVESILSGTTFNNPIDGMSSVQHTLPPKLPSVIDSSQPALSDAISRQMILNQSRDTKTTTFVQNSNVPEPPRLAKHVISRLENYFQKEPQPTVAVAEFLASNLGVETSDIHLWFHHRRQQERMKCLLQNLKIDDTRPAVTNGARMILPGDLNTLLEIFPSTRSVLLVDLRSSTDFEKSHIHGAINLRAPLSFIQNMPLESIQDTFVDDQSRRTFNKWFQSRCMVFYDRVVEYGWECPVADALCERFRRKGWLGQCFILKGHYREFSDSFDNHISGSKMTSAAKEHLDGFREHPTPSAELQRRHAQYDQWLRTFESQDRSAAYLEADETQLLGRRKAVHEHQKELEAEFETRFPALYHQSQSLRPAPATRASTSHGDKPWAGGVSAYSHEAAGRGKAAMANDDVFDGKAHLVGPLASGLDKMREATAAGGGTPAPGTHMGGAGGWPFPSAGYTDKLGETAGCSDDFDDIDVRSEGVKNDAAFQQAGGAGRGGYRSPSTNDLAAAASAPGATAAGSDDHRKGRTRHLWNRLRSGK
ncbi:hypothetical protein P8C59_004888 [Phyllachora maydis]|uniref:Homeobox domain-containing protein n=1 Tax=Phyllachora maydis TaxID=1825666 RepID=A0AAD9MCY5_9PEZI|nr:hypothetical protein P8C59_004888 [Phyllachora maydis]